MVLVATPPPVSRVDYFRIPLNPTALHRAGELPFEPRHDHLLLRRPHSRCLPRLGWVGLPGPAHPLPQSKGSRRTRRSCAGRIRNRPENAVRTRVPRENDLTPTGKIKPAKMLGNSRPRSGNSNQAWGLFMAELRTRTCVFWNAMAKGTCTPAAYCSSHEGVAGLGSCRRPPVGFVSEFARRQR